MTDAASSTPARPTAGAVREPSGSEVLTVAQDSVGCALLPVFPGLLAEQLDGFDWDLRSGSSGEDDGPIIHPRPRFWTSPDERQTGQNDPWTCTPRFAVELPRDAVWSLNVAPGRATRHKG
jgi:hypothetical protein